MPPNELVLNLRSRKIAKEDDLAIWQIHEVQKQVPAGQTALILCDVWDTHWCRGARERLNQMIPRMDDTVRHARDRGVHIVHAPSNTLDFYKGHPARARILDLPEVPTPPDLPHPDPPMPVDASDNGRDSLPHPEPAQHQPWTRQHAGIFIDPVRDVISDEGPRIFSYLAAENITQVIIAGVHTNMCVLNRSFAIKQMVRWGVNIALARDLTDCMYNPARPPYTSHEEGTRLIVEYIEAFWCPTLLSRDLL